MNGRGKIANDALCASLNQEMNDCLPRYLFWARIVRRKSQKTFAQFRLLW